MIGLFFIFIDTIITHSLKFVDIITVFPLLIVVASQMSLGQKGRNYTGLAGNDGWFQSERYNIKHGIVDSS